MSLTFVLAVPGLLACGDDNPNTEPTPDAAKPPIDGAPDGPPPPTFKGYDANEGGEIRAEYVRFSNGNAGSRVTNFLFKNSGTMKYFEYINQNGCTITSTDMHWPVATNPIAERVYMDPGTVTIAGGSLPLNVPKRVMGNDPFGRTHPADQWRFDPAAPTDVDGGIYFPEKTSLDVSFGGSADMPAQIFDNALYMPADFALTTPGHTTYPIPTYPIPAGTPQTFTWTTPTDTPPAGVEILSLVAFTGPNGPAVVCVEPNDGSITVPAAMIDAARLAYPAGGTLARQTLTHQVRELVDASGPTGKRIDFVAVWCYATGFVVP
ncbi:MAG: hypothetical protein H0X17_08200 [Deltaproteobacteria bacterium]|nr:hypothetical protein [Deltaproteobacteria bacterium]